MVQIYQENGKLKNLNENFLEWIPPGERPIGRPRKQWIEGVSDDTAKDRRKTLE